MCIVCVFACTCVSACMGMFVCVWVFCMCLCVCMHVCCADMFKNTNCICQISGIGIVVAIAAALNWIQKSKIDVL